MTRKSTKPADQTSFGTPGATETPGALRSPPVASGEPRRLLSSTPFQSSSGECRLKGVRRAAKQAAQKMPVVADNGGPRKASN